jgi:alpha-galactosidase
MMNAPLMLGLDLRRVEVGDWIYRIIANRDLIAINQDALGVQAKRVWSSLLDGEAVSDCSDNTALACDEAPDRAYITDINRVDILAKPLADGSVAISFVNVSEQAKDDGYCVTVPQILAAIGDRLPNREAWEKAESFLVKDVWSGEEVVAEKGGLAVSELAPCDNVTLRVRPVR